MPRARIVAARVAAPAVAHNNPHARGAPQREAVHFYPSDQKELAERLRLALEAEGHEVFTDRAELKEGEPYYTRRCARPSKASDALVFLITPRSIRLAATR